MAFFKFRKRGDDAATTAAPVEGVEKLRRRAKHRLIGTVILVLVGVIGFPMLVDKQPRPVAVNIPIEIPDKNKAKPLAVPPLPTTAPQAAAKGRVIETVEPPPATQTSTQVQPDIKPEPKAAEKVVEKIAPKEMAKEASKAPDKAPEKAPEKAQSKPTAEKTPDDSALRPQALLEGKEPSKAAPTTEGRFIVQVGAFADVAKAREVRQKLEQAGLKTYTQAVETKDGQRIRVRVGPFGSKAEADKAAEKIKKLDLPAAILTL